MMRNMVVGIYEELDYLTSLFVVLLGSALIGIF